jgi:hypothetical protein
MRAMQTLIAGMARSYSGRRVVCCRRAMRATCMLRLA